MRQLLIAAVVISLAACGGGGGNAGSGGSNVFGAGNGGSGTNVFGVPNPVPTAWQAGIFQPAASYKSSCAAPRNGLDPATGQPYADVAGNSTSENNWLRSWTNETYLWFDEVPDLDPGLYATSAYFPLLKSSAVTPSGNPKDQFHFTYPTPDWIALAQSGVQSGYGAQWFVVAPAPPRRIVVAFVEPGSPAAQAGLSRGDEVLGVDGVDAVAGGSQANVTALNAGLFPASTGQTHAFTLRTVSGTQYSVSLQSAAITSTPVRNTAVIASGGQNVGYFVFNDHIATSEAQLVSAITTLRDANVTDLVLDVRYNGGGFLDIASELAYMIAGPVPTAGRTFERLTFNSKNPTTDPVTGQGLTPVPFYTTTQGFGGTGTSGQNLPTLNLPRVFVITGSGTCSASESIINSLRGVDVTVIQIGTTTCGKPYGFYPTDNCGTTYFTIQFKGVNAKEFGEYPDGFTPANSVVGTIGERVPGCAVSDDFSHQLGDPAEARLAAALQYRQSATCPSPPSTGPIGLAKVQSGMAAEEGYLARPEAREIRLLRPF